MTNRRVGILMGGWSGERDVSLRTGEGVARALESRGHRVVRIAFGEGGASLHDMIRDAEIDVAFIALHGRGGEDGCVQGLLETMCIPYTGSNVLASALAMDKVKSKEMFRLHNVPTPPHYVVTSSDLADLEEVHGSFGFPVIVKPRAEGSSIGVSKASSMAELAQAIELALEKGTHAIIERFVRGMEVHVGILDGRVLGGIEVVPKSGI
ncbi:MAG: D-alanine--D-alanine ligase, partial [Polyangiaceae bacterium]